VDDGRGDFDFLFGRWLVRNRKLVDVLDPHCAEWIEFEADSETRPVLGGLGNMDAFSVAAMPPEGKPYDGMALRLFDPNVCLWRIWWTSTRTAGRLDAPVEGKFVQGHGQFFGEDVLNGQAVKVRFDWRISAQGSIRWTQAFSYDGAGAWTVNWEMIFQRAA
jgi:hypothetical protein